MPRFRWRRPYGAATSEIDARSGSPNSDADADERLLRDEVRAHELEQLGAALEDLEQAPVAAEVVLAELVEEPGRPADVQALLARLDELGERRGELVQERALARRRAPGPRSAPRRSRAPSWSPATARSGTRAPTRRGRDRPAR